MQLSCGLVDAYRYEHPRPTTRGTLSLLVSTFCPSFCCAAIIALMCATAVSSATLTASAFRFFMPYFFVVYQPNHAPEDWQFTPCTVVSKSAKALSTSRQSQDMFYTLFTVRGPHPLSLALAFAFVVRYHS